MATRTCAALAQRTTAGYSRLWGEIETFSRRFGISRGGHLERFLRPYFNRLVPLRHALETQPGQVGAAYFIGGRLAGIEVAPTAEYWQDIAPILTIYCYGPAALMAERRRWEPSREAVDLHDLRDLGDLERRLRETRERERRARTDEVEAVARAAWDYTAEEDRHGLRVLTAQQGGTTQDGTTQDGTTQDGTTQGDWQGQIVRSGDHESEAVYLSLFRDVTAQPVTAAVAEPKA
jgi:hypothetical protein